MKDILYDPALEAEFKKLEAEMEAEFKKLIAEKDTEEKAPIFTS